MCYKNKQHHRTCINQTHRYCYITFLTSTWNSDSSRICLSDHYILCYVFICTVFACDNLLFICHVRWLHVMWISVNMLYMMLLCDYCSFVCVKRLFGIIWCRTCLYRFINSVVTKVVICLTLDVYMWFYCFTTTLTH